MDNEQINEIAVQNLTNEIGLIDDRWIRIFVSRAVRAAPGKYWKKPAGNHPGHHPDDEQGDWGNLIHVKRVIVIASLLAEAENFQNMYKDILYAGLIIHDLGKYGVDGLNESIVKEHPLLVRVIVKNLEPCPLLGLILGVAEAHMGRWGKTWPGTQNERLGHYADYIACQCFIHIPVELDV